MYNKHLLFKCARYEHKSNQCLDNILTSMYGGLKGVHAFLSKSEYKKTTDHASFVFQWMPTELLSENYTETRSLLTELQMPVLPTRRNSVQYT